MEKHDTYVKERILVYLILVFAFMGAISSEALALAFPGAEGFGALSVGGRGGQVYKVTNLNSSGPGSLQAAASANGPRIVIFDVSGVIRGDITITNPYITIAGQTAPGAGITIEGLITSYNNNVHDVIIRHIRVRPRRASGSGGDAIQMGGTGSYNIILDHVSLSWANDEAIDLIHARNVTVQWSTIEETDTLGHDKGVHNFGLLNAYEGSGNISMHHNLWTHHDRRVPAVAPYEANAPADFRNNVVYNVRNALGHAGHQDNIQSPINVFNNYYKRGPDVERLYPFALWNGVSYYIDNNFIEGWGLVGNPKDWSWGGVPPWIQFNQNGTKLNSAAAVTPNITTHTALEAYEVVMEKAGAWPRDRVTLRMLQEVSAGTGQWGRNAPLTPSNDWFLQGLTPSSPPQDSDNDGMPDNWESARGLNPNYNDNDTILSSGYTAIEEYINERADILVGDPPPATFLSAPSNLRIVSQ
jgi:pectate lyase